MREETGLPASLRVTLGSVEVTRVGAWDPGHLQSSAVSPRRLGRAGSEDSCLAPGGDVWIPGGGFGQSTFQCPFMPQLGHGPGGGLGFRHEQAQWPSLPHLKQGPDGFLSFWLMEAVAKRWYLAWSCWAFSSFACSSRLLKILKAKFKRSCWGVWGPSSAFF